MQCYNQILLTDKHGVLHRVPCGQCINCRLNKARMWSIRIMHECKKYDKTVFLTLTYDEEHLPARGSLVKKHLQDFMKRFRFNHGKKVRYYACGEYGDHTARPHYHIAFFGVGYDDFYNLKPAKKGGYQARCKEWPYGLVHIGELTIDSANYVAGYVLKKQTGKQRQVYVDLGVVPPFCVMSRRPGIGADFADENAEQFRRFGYVIAKGAKYALPRFYRERLQVKKTADEMKRKAEFFANIKEKAEQWKKSTWQVEFDYWNQIEADAKSKLKMKGRKDV